MTSVSWTSAASGDWTVASNWDTGNEPGTSDDVFISVAGSYTVSLTAAVTVASITIGDASAVLRIQDPGGDDVVTGNLDNAGALLLDGNNFSSEGGSTLTVAGTLTNTGGINIGPPSGNLTANTTLIAGALAGTGSVGLFGGTNQAVADIAAAAPTTLAFDLALFGHSLLQYGSGQIGTIANGVSLLIDGPNALVADASGTTTNSALDGLAENDGTLRIINGASVGITGNFLNTGALLLDGDSFSSEGASALTVSGTLTNTGGIDVGPPSGNLTANTTLIAGALAGTGSVGLFGGTNQAMVDIAAAAPTTLAFDLALLGNSLLQYGSGQIGTIANGVSLLVDGPNALVADASGTTTNSALDSLAENDGTLRIINGASVGITGNFLNAGALLLDGDSFSAEGGSTLTVSGTLTNTGGIDVGPPSGNLTANTTLIAGALAGTGSVGLFGSTNQAVVDIAAAAPTTLAFDLALLGNSLLQYGSGQIGTIANGVSLLVDGPNALVADASGTTTNSALDSLAENDGTLRFINGASVGITGNFLNTGALLLDGDSFSSEGASALTVSGTLTNTGGIDVGPPSGNLNANTTLIAGALAGTGSLGLFGGTNQAMVDIAAAAPTTLAFNVSLFGHSLLEYGSGQVGTIASGVSLELDGPTAFLADASATTTNSALDSLAENDGTLRIINGASVGITGNFLNTGALLLDGDAFSSEGGSALTVSGTLTNTGGINVGPPAGNLTANTTLIAGALAGTGSVGLFGGTNQAMVDIAAAAPATLAYGVTLLGNSLLEYGSGQIGTIASGVSLVVNGPTAFLADASATTTNSALDSLAENDGTLRIINGASVGITGNFLNAGVLLLDGDSFSTEGASTLTVSGTLTNTGGINVGPPSGNLTANTTLIAGALAGTGSVGLFGGTNQAVVDIAAAAPTTLAFNVSLFGHSLLEYGSGQIGTIASGVSLELDGPTAFLADASATTTNSALDSLAENDGTLRIINGASVGITGNFLNTGALLLDGDGFSTEGASTLTVSGTLTDTGGIDVGPGSGNLTANTTLIAGALAGTGSVGLFGGTNQAVVDIATAAPTTLAFNVSLFGHSLLEYGSGQIGTIASGVSLVVDGPNALVADASATTTNSALDSLTENDGTLRFIDGVSVGITGDLLNGGGLVLDGDSFSSEGGSTFAVTGTLTNTDFINIGPSSGNLTANTTLMTGELVNSGAIALHGNPNQADLEVTGAVSDSGAIFLGSGATLATVGNFTQTAGSTQVGGVLAAATVAIAGGVLDLIGGSVEASALSIAGGATLLGDGTVMPAVASAGSIEASGGTLDLAGGLASPAAIAIENASALELAGADSGSVTFAGSSGILELDDPIGFTGTLSGLAVGDTLVLRDTQATGAVASFDSATNTSTLAVTLAGGGTLDFTLAGNYAGDAFGTNQVGNDTQIAAVGAAVGQINTALPVVLGTVRQGTTATTHLSITNNAPTGSAALDVSIGGLTGGATASGTITALAPGATDTTDISVGVGGSVGAQTGTVTLDFASDLAGGNTAPLPSESVTVSGTVYREAIAAITPLTLFAHVGDPGVETLEIRNVATADGFSEDLIATLTGVTGGFTVSSTVPSGDIAPGASDAVTQTLSYSTAQTGVVSGDATFALTSDGGTGVGSIDGLGTIALPAQVVPISIDIDSFATAAIEAPVAFGTLTSAGNATTLDLGTVAENTGLFDLNFGVVNLASGQADLLSGSFVATAANGFALTSLGTFSGLGAGQATADSVTLDTSVGGVVSQTITLLPTDSNPGGYSAPLTPQTVTITGTVEPLPPPTITVAPTLATMTEVPALVGLSIGDPNVDTLPLTVTVSDTSGSLTAQTNGSATVSGDGSNMLTLTGDVTELNHELDTLAYMATSVGTDTINVTVEDQHHAFATQTIAVATSPVPFTAPVINTPTLDLATAESVSGLGGLSLADPSAMATDGTVTLTFLSDGPLTITGSSGATITGNGTDTVMITGTVPQIDADLSDGLEGLYLETLAGSVATANAEKTLISLAQDIGSGTATAGKLNADFQKLITPPDATDLVAALAGSEGAWFVFGVEAASYAINSIIAEIPGNEPPESAGFLSAAIEFVRMFGGGTHIVAPGGSIFSMDATGEFVLAASTQAGDSLLVQVRLQPVAGSSSASEVTQVAASVGNDRVTFGVGRASVAWVDGVASDVSLTNPVTLSGGTLSQISADAYQVVYNTGEVLTVTTAGSYLDVQIAPGANNSAGTIVGLANWTQEASGLFTLPGGAVLTGPLTTAQFYGEFVDAWRIPQSLSLFDYAPGQTTATFTDPDFPETPIALADLPATVVAQAEAAVAAAGITDPGIAQAAEFDYIASGGNPNTIIDDANQAEGITTTAAPVTPSPGVAAAIGVMADQPQVLTSNSGSTPVVFDVYLTGTAAAATTVDYAVVAAGAGYVGAASFGGTLPTGSVTIAAGEIESQFTIDLPLGALGDVPTESLDVSISSPDGTPLFVSSAQDTIHQEIPGPPPVPTLVDLTNLGSFSQSGNNYTLDLGQIQAAAPIPPIQFEIENAAAAPSDALGGTFTVDPVEGFTVSGASLPGLLAAGASYQGLQVTATDTKFGQNSETITFDPTDSNNTGFSADLAPITLTITDTVVPPTMVFSYAWGDVHIITYNGLTYNFQAEGEFTLAKSRVPGDSFDIQLRLEPWFAGASVTTIQQVAVSVGTDKVTFGQGRPDTVWVDGVPSTITAADPVVSLDGGQLLQISPTVWQVTWNTGEEATITNAGNYFNVSDGIPLAEPDLVGGLQGEDAGPSNDFQLADGTVLKQPLTSSVLYGEFASSWRVTQASSLFDYLPGQTTATFTDTNFPTDVVSLSDLPGNLVAAAAQMVAAAGITDPNIAAAAEYDYIATGDPSFIAAGQQISTQVTNTTAVPVQASTPPVAAVGVEAQLAGLIEAASGPTPVTFDAYLTTTSSSDIVVDYTVVAAGTGFVDAATFGGTLPSGSVTISAGGTLAPITIDLPQNALGALASEQLEVQVSAPGGSPVFAPVAVATIANSTAQSGVAPIPQLLELSQAGTLIENSATSYTLDLGTLTQGGSSTRVQLGIANAATPVADELSGTFSPPTGTGFVVTGDDLPGAIVAGGQYDGLYVSPLTATAGENTETLVFKASDVNDSGFVAALSPITLTITDTVTAPGVGQLNTPQTIVFPNVHVGTPESRDLNVSNTGAAPIEVSVAAADPIIAQGTIASLAPGATDKTDLSIGVDTSSAGALSGAVNVNFGSTDPIVDTFGDVFRLASGTVAPVTDFVHVGDPGTIGVDISNTATADGFSENLLGTLTSVTGNIGIAAAGPTGEIAAGSSDTSSLLLDFSSAHSGTITGTATVDLTSDGGTGADSIDGLGTTALGSQITPVTITVDNFANPVFDSTSDIGTFAQNGTAYSLDLGAIQQNSAPFAVDLGVLNDVAGPADVASGTFQVSGSSAFTNSGLDPFLGLAAEQADVLPMVTLATGTTGTFSETITLAATGSNAGGFSAALPNETLTVTGTVVASGGGTGTPAPAVASVAAAGTIAFSAGTIDFGAVHVGATAQESLAVSNTATAGAAALDGSVAGTLGSATASGSFSGLAAGAPASTAVGVGLNTGTVGPQSGTVELAFVSDAGTAGLSGLPNQDITVSGSVYREAAAALLPINEIVHVGDPGTASISVSNTDPLDRYSESLIAALIGASGGIDIDSAGPTGDIVAGGTSSALAVGFSTAQAATISGVGTIALTSDGGSGPDSIDGLGTTALGDQTVAVNVTVDNFANAELTSSGNLTANGSNAFTLNLGSTTEGAAALSAHLGVLNDVGGPADWLSGTLIADGNSQFTNGGLGAFGTINAGQSVAAGSVSLATNQLGTFSESIVLTPMDTNAGGFSEVLAKQTVTVVGTILPVGTALGDVHMVTYDGLHYDFQADGDFVLTRSTVPGDDFQIQIATAPDAANNAVSYTTEAAAQVGTDLVTFAIDRASTVWVDGTPDTALSAADPIQTLDGGQLQELSTNSFRLTWTSGETLTITDQGSHLDTSVGLGANGPGSMQGLLGSDSGQANDFQLPDGTVLARPLSGSELYGTFAKAWAVAPTDSLLGDPATTDGTDPAVAPVAIGTTAAGTLQFIYADAGGQTVLQADAVGEVLRAGSGANVLSDAGGFGVTFRGLLPDFANELISGFSAKDVIDITDLNSATVATSYAGSGSAGVLYVTDGTQSGELYVAGQLAGESFRAGPDGHGGTQIAFG